MLGVGMFAVVWVGGWSAGTLFFDGFIAYFAYQQWRADSYPATTGTVVSSRLDSHSDGEGGTNYTAVIRYSYEVNGQVYESDNVRYGMTSSMRNDAQRTVDAHPYESSVTVYFNPSDPQDAVLQPGISGSELMMALFLTPFNAIMFGAWVFVFNAVRNKLRSDAAHAVDPKREGNPYRGESVYRLRVPCVGPFTVGLATAGALAFVCTFLVGFTGGFDPSMAYIGTVWAVVLGAAFFFAGQRALSIWRGEHDLVIDEPNGTLLLPKSGKRKQPMTVALNDIVEFILQIDRETDSDGDTHKHPTPTMKYVDGNGKVKKEKIGRWSNRDAAEHVTAWLNEVCTVERGLV